LRYERSETLTMRDGGTTALDWLGLDEPPDAPTLVVLHTITGDSQSMRQIVADLRAGTGFRVVSCTRRGHGGLPLTASVINTMGCTHDLREQLAHIREQFPDSPLYAVGTSAGSALLARYLGEEGPNSCIRAAVAYCPGYDISVAWSRVRPFYARALTRVVKRHFLEPNAPLFAHLDTFSACMAATDPAAFHAHFYELAGYRSYDEYLAGTNPVQLFGQIAVPVLVINADDDPVCVVENTLDHLGVFQRTPDALLVRTKHGSHCGFFEGWTAGSWANRLMAEYLCAVHDYLQRGSAG
jgi:predicted alpha/beta-fold hydrolase